MYVDSNFVYNHWDEELKTTWLRKRATIVW